ncbi:MAG: lipoyl(octanoyl) transferase LipB [Thermoleophilia bacterium]
MHTSPNTTTTRPAIAPIRPFDLGIVPYREAQELQRRLRRAVAGGLLPGALLVLEHPVVITLGSRAGLADLRGEAVAHGKPVEVVHSERGGAATLHAPGQLVAYPVMPIPGRDLRRYVRGLEEVLVRLLADLGIVAERSPGRPGLYVAGDKIASVGLRCERWVASHGTSLNVSLDLGLFDLIVSCGEHGLRQTSIAELTGSAPSMEELKSRYVQIFAEVFGIALAPLQPATLRQIADLTGA